MMKATEFETCWCERTISNKHVFHKFICRSCYVNWNRYSTC